LVNLYGLFNRCFHFRIKPFDEIFFEDKRNDSNNAPSGTEFIFNAGTQITAESKSESAGVDNLTIWLKIQEF